jgi:hypothetical protein
VIAGHGLGVNPLSRRPDLERLQLLGQGSGLVGVGEFDPASLEQRATTPLPLPRGPDTLSSQTPLVSYKSPIDTLCAWE